MLIDPQNSPVSGGLLLAGALYAGISVFVTGPLIGERTIEKSDWAQTCSAALASNTPASQTLTPQENCHAIVGVMAREFAPMCDLLGGFPTQQNHQPKSVSTLSRCDCAASVALENRTAWALYAGSARLVTPQAVKHLDSELVRALHTPHCALKFGGVS